jgi:hypothetical protein
LRAEFTIDGQAQVRGLYLRPDCPPPDTELADCYDPPGDHPQCLAKCDALSTWKHLGGSAPMHVFKFPLLDDGGNSGPLVETVHLTLSTLDGSLVWDGEQTENLAPLPDNRVGTFHNGLMEFELTRSVLAVLGQTCLSPF